MALPFQVSAAEVVKQLDTSLDVGLTDDEVAKLQEKYGRNELEAEEKTPLWKLVVEQFEDSLVYCTRSVPLGVTTG